MRRALLTVLAVAAVTLFAVAIYRSAYTPEEEGWPFH